MIIKAQQAPAVARPNSQANSSNAGSPNAAAPATPDQAQTPVQDQWTSVTFDKETQTFHYEKPGAHRSQHLDNPLKESLKFAAIAGAPALLGAGLKSAFGGASHSLFDDTLTSTVWLAGSAAGGALGLGGYWGRQSMKEHNGHPVLVFFSGVGGAIVGGAGLPLLQLPGAIFGLKGAAIASGVAGLATLGGVLYSNHKIKEEAAAAGFKG